MSGPPSGAAVTVLVSLGTDHHRFDRLVDWVDHWVAAHPGRARCMAQVGTSKPSATGVTHALLSPADLAAEMAAANAVVCHGGPGTIMDARRAGVEPIVVPRSGRLGEHVDDHQERFARWMAAHDRLVATDETDLHRLLDRALTTATPTGGQPEAWT
ncbi:MAG: glycosyltransferase [Acidimicrobiales bacterium]